MAFLHPSSVPSLGKATTTHQLFLGPTGTKLRHNAPLIGLTPSRQHHNFHHTNAAPLKLLAATNLPITASINAASVSSKYSGIAHVFQLFVAFILGGLFFSTTLSVATAFFAVGKENMLRGWKIFKAVSGTVWSVFTYGLQVARDTLLSIEDGEERKKWKWREAWQVNKEHQNHNKKAPMEGVQAIKHEAKKNTAVN